MDKNLQKIFEEASAPSNPFRMLFLKDSLRILPGFFPDPLRICLGFLIWYLSRRRRFRGFSAFHCYCFRGYGSAGHFLWDSVGILPEIVRGGRQGEGEERSKKRAGGWLNICDIFRESNSIKESLKSGKFAISLDWIGLNFVSQSQIGLTFQSGGIGQDFAHSSTGILRRESRIESSS